MDYHMLEEQLTDYFARLHHDPAVARTWAQTVVHIARQCDEEIASGDRGIVLVPLIEEGDVAIRTITQFAAEGGAR
jgi:hypothetical protein